jgi:hypothetical protein
MNQLLQMFRSLPRAAQWGILAAVVFGGYFLVVEPILDITNRHDAAADAIEINLRRTGELSGEDSDDGRLLVSALKNFGRPHLPNARETRPEAIQRVVDEILEDHGVETRTKNERNTTLTGDRARAIAGEDRLERFIVEVSFEADQATVAKIIADLEQSPVVSAVSRVKIDRTVVSSRNTDGAEAASGRVRATINAESWVLVHARPGSDSNGDAS